MFLKKKYLAITFFLLLSLITVYQQQVPSFETSQSSNQNNGEHSTSIDSKNSFTNDQITLATDSARTIIEAFQKKRNNVEVHGVGKVIKLLADDTKGSQHQRFILELINGHTLLIAHNIDLAPRIDSLKKGDTIEFYGEYEYNSRGGVVHWTHKDPKNRHHGGWLKHQGRIYE